MTKKKRAAKRPVKRRRLFWAAAAAACLLLGAVLWRAAVRPAQLELPYLTARSVVVLDGESGQSLYDKDGDTPRSPGSVTKLMTLLLVLDDIESGAVGWEDEYTVGREEAEALGSVYGMRPGEVFSVRQLVAGAALPSGCDCVQCLVRLCAGDEESFVRRMNDKAEELGLKGSSFANATGIDASGHYMTARDIAALAAVLVESHPELLDFTSRRTMEVDGRSFTNTNRLAGRDPRVLGLKTGTTQIGGCNLVTYARAEERSAVIVLLDSNSSDTRFSETETVMDALFGEGTDLG